MKSLLLCIVFGAIACSCYRMPTENDYCLVPSTNNPIFTREKASPMPGVGY